MSRHDIIQGSPVHKRPRTNKTHHLLKNNIARGQITCDMSQVLFDMLHDITCPSVTHLPWPS